MGPLTIRIKIHQVALNLTWSEGNFTFIIHFLHTSKFEGMNFFKTRTLKKDRNYLEKNTLFTSMIDK